MKINLAIDCVESSAIDTLTTLHSFLIRNSWFDGKVYVMVLSPSSISQKTISNISSIYENFEIVYCSNDLILSDLVSKYGDDQDKISKLFTLMSLFVQEEKVLFVSSTCFFLKDVSDLLEKDKISFPRNTLGEINESIFYRSNYLDLVKNKKELFDKFIENNESVSSLVSSSDNINKSTVLCENSSDLNDKVFMKKKNTLSFLHIINYNTLRKEIRISTKVNQIWLQHRNIIFNMLKRPILRSGKTIVKTPAKLNFPTSLNTEVAVIENQKPVLGVKQQMVNRAQSADRKKLITIDELKKAFLNKTVCMVANSSDLLLEEHGDFIDSHDCVVRFNSFTLDQVHTGVKTTIHASIYLESANLDLFVEYRMIISINKNNWLNRIASLDPDKQDKIIDVNWPISISPTPSYYSSNKIPTTGFNLILLFYEHINYSSLSLVGFNFYKNGVDSIYRKDGISNTIAKVHNYSFEEKWISSVFSEKNKIFIHEKSVAL